MRRDGSGRGSGERLCGLNVGRPCCRAGLKWGSSLILLSWISYCFTVWFLAWPLKDLPKKRGFFTFKGTFLSERQTFLRWDSTVNNKEGLTALWTIWGINGSIWTVSGFTLVYHHQPSTGLNHQLFFFFFLFLCWNIQKIIGYVKKKNLLFSSAFL